MNMAHGCNDDNRRNQSSTITTTNLTLT